MNFAIIDKVQDTIDVPQYSKAVDSSRDGDDP